MKEKKVVLTVYISTDLKEWLEGLSKREGRSLTNMAERIFRERRSAEGRGGKKNV